MFLTATAFILCFCMVGLAVSNLISLAKNITHIDLLKGTFVMWDKQGLNPNPYDLGTLTNLSNFFEAEKWTFWWPSALIPRADGTVFYMIPPVTEADKTTLYPNIR